MILRSGVGTTGVPGAGTPLYSGETLTYLEYIVSSKHIKTSGLSKSVQLLNLAEEDSFLSCNIE